MPFSNEKNAIVSFKDIQTLNLLKLYSKTYRLRKFNINIKLFKINKNQLNKNNFHKNLCLFDMVNVLCKDIQTLNITLKSSQFQNTNKKRTILLALFSFESYEGNEVSPKKDSNCLSWVQKQPILRNSSFSLKILPYFQITQLILANSFFSLEILPFPHKFYLFLRQPSLF